MLPPSYSCYTPEKEKEKVKEKKKKGKKRKKTKKEKRKRERKERYWENSHTLIIIYHNLGYVMISYGT